MNFSRTGLNWGLDRFRLEYETRLSIDQSGMRFSVLGFADTFPYLRAAINCASPA